MSTAATAAKPSDVLRAQLAARCACARCGAALETLRGRNSGHWDARHPRRAACANSEKQTGFLFTTEAEAFAAGVAEQWQQKSASPEALHNADRLIRHWSLALGARRKMEGAVS